jgi:hypothetical protein
MPQGDRTGPLGQGPMTGRGLGYCGRGFGFRNGFGRGFRNGFGRGFGNGFQPIQLTESEEKKVLQEELEELENERQEIQKRLKEIK